jgi:hypothetical protein
MHIIDLLFSFPRFGPIILVVIAITNVNYCVGS